jgi:hypothetical protein
MIYFLIIQHGLYPLLPICCRCSAALPYYAVDLVPLTLFYNSTLADLETSYHLLTSIYYKNSLNLTMSLATKYYP